MLCIFFAFYALFIYCQLLVLCIISKIHDLVLKRVRVLELLLLCVLLSLRVLGSLLFPSHHHHQNYLHSDSYFLILCCLHNILIFKD
ncbi:hypothetical protein FKM82_006154 [Ascaphus truei]